MFSCFRVFVFLWASLLVFRKNYSQISESVQKIVSMDAFSVFFSQPVAAMPPCHPDGNRSLYEGKNVVTRRRVNGSVRMTRRHGSNRLQKKCKNPDEHGFLNTPKYQERSPLKHQNTKTHECSLLAPVKNRCVHAFFLQFVYNLNRRIFIIGTEHHHSSLAVGGF